MTCPRLGCCGQQRRPGCTRRVMGAMRVPRLGLLPHGRKYTSGPMVMKIPDLLLQLAERGAAESLVGLMIPSNTRLATRCQWPIAENSRAVASVSAAHSAPLSSSMIGQLVKSPVGVGVPATFYSKANARDCRCGHDCPSRPTVTGFTGLPEAHTPVRSRPRLPSRTAAWGRHVTSGDEISPSDAGHTAAIAPAAGCVPAANG
jgi:hypothetical protein